MFIRKYWIPLLVFSIAIFGVGLYLLVIQPAPEPIAIIKPAEPIEESTAENPTVENPRVGTEVPSDTSQDGHFHSDGTWHAEPHEPGEESSNISVPTPTRTGQLTYHAELLASNPVEALRQQAKERGHWSADHIPPFPPDDQEAAGFARNIYLVIYYMQTGQIDHPDYLRAGKTQSNFFHALRSAYDAGLKNPRELARHHDLMKITWTMIEPFDRLPRWRTTFTEGINPESARPLLPFELDDSLWHSSKTD